MNIHKSIIEYYTSKDSIFKEILYSNQEIKKIIDKMIYNFLDRPVLEFGKGYTETLGQCYNISNFVKNVLLEIQNPRIIGVSEINGIVYDENKMDDGYNIDGDIYTSHTALDLFIWDEKYTKIIKYHIDFTVNQFALKEYTNDMFIESIDNLHGDLFRLGDSELVYLEDDNEYVDDELSSRGYIPEYIFNEGYFIKILKTQKGIIQDIFPFSIIDKTPVINYLMKDYSIDHICLLTDSEIQLIFINDRLDEIDEGKILYELDYKLIEKFTYNN